MTRSGSKTLLVLGLGFLLGAGVQLHREPDAARALAGTGEKASPEQRLKELKLDLPAVPRPVNTYVTAVRVGDMLYISGTGPGNDAKGKAIVGRLGAGMNLEQGKAAARQVGLHILAAVKQDLGSLDRVERLVKTLGMVNSAPEFDQQPKVINGFSDLMVEVFGPEKGKGARSAVGMVALPGGIPVEIEVIFQIKK